ncbi:esterase [Listeria costaricensis]|uniref:esterase n=1 Tax=Listeria costaricensis TaxID=2026604 RepID=UPI000C083A5B|nr:esterase [Listeria costaricensis]
MILVDHQTIAEIPVLNIVKEDNQGKSLPTIFFYHGFGSQKELYLHYGYLLAQRGFRVILPDAKLHGERQGEADESEQAVYFWHVVQSNIDELLTLKEELLARHEIDPERIGVGGVSMGAITSLGMLARYDWIKVGVSLMGSAYYGHFAKQLLIQATDQGLQFPYDVDERLASLNPYDLSEQLEKLGDRPLYLWHGKMDNVVPFAYSERLYQTLVEDGEAENVKLVVDEKAKHKVSIEGILGSVSFFEKYL